jgi:hypothetical protein
MNLGVLVDTLELVPRLGFRLEGWIGDWSSKYCAKYRLPSIVCLSLIVKGRVLSATHAHPSIYIDQFILRHITDDHPPIINTTRPHHTPLHHYTSHTHTKKPKKTQKNPKKPKNPKKTKAENPK